MTRTVPNSSQRFRDPLMSGSPVSPYGEPGTASRTERTVPDDREPFTAVPTDRISKERRQHRRHG